MRLSHIINPVKVKPTSDLYVAQPVTFESMRRAKEYAAGQLEIQLLSTQYIEDRDIIPDYIHVLEDLNKSVNDIYNFRVKRKLPLLKDILDILYKNSEGADYLIYTNVDIALQPNFYTAVAEYIKKGYDGILINRRTVPKTYESISDIELMYSFAGEKHGGIDCLIFKREAYPNYKLANAYIGFDPIGKVLGTNILLHANQFLWLWDAALTFHIGNDKTWFVDNFSDYRTENYHQYIKSLELLLNQDYIQNNALKKKIIERSIAYAEHFMTFLLDSSFQPYDIWGVHLKEMYTNYGLENYEKVEEECAYFISQRNRLSDVNQTIDKDKPIKKGLISRIIRKVGTILVSLSDKIKI